MLRRPGADEAAAHFQIQAIFSARSLLDQGEGLGCVGKHGGRQFDSGSRLLPLKLLPILTPPLTAPPLRVLAPNPGSFASNDTAVTPSQTSSIAAERPA